MGKSDFSAGLLNLTPIVLWEILRAACGGIEGWARLGVFYENFLQFVLHFAVILKQNVLKAGSMVLS